MPIPKATEVNLSAEEQEGLEQLVRRHNVGQQIALRGRIILLAGEGQTSSAIARQFGSASTRRNAGAIVGQKHKRYPTRI